MTGWAYQRILQGRRYINFDFEKKRRRTRGEFNPYLALLEEWNVLESAEVDSREFARAAAKFFCVLKANGKLRAIFDSRMAGEMGSRPPPVRLPFLSTVIKRGAECKHFWTADFKHWFYQIRICYKLREFFVTKMLSVARQEGAHLFPQNEGPSTGVVLVSLHRTISGMPGTPRQTAQKVEFWGPEKSKIFGPQKHIESDPETMFLAFIRV